MGFLGGGGGGEDEAEGWGVGHGVLLRDELIFDFRAEGMQRGESGVRGCPSLRQEQMRREGGAPGQVRTMPVLFNLLLNQFGLKLVTSQRPLSLATSNRYAGFEPNSMRSLQFPVRMTWRSSALM